MGLLNKILGQKGPYTTFNYLNWVKLTNKRIKSEIYLHPHCKEEKPELFHGFDAPGTEIETLNLLWALTRLFKPQYVLETGSFHANGTIALAAALKENGFGKLVSLELEADRVKQANKRLKRAKLLDHVELVAVSSLDYADNVDVNKIKFDLAFFDTHPDLRPIEFQKLYDRGALTNLVAFHDTSRLHAKSLPNDEMSQKIYVSKLDEIEKKYARGGIEFSLSRGLRVMQLRQDINPAFK